MVLQAITKKILMNSYLNYTLKFLQNIRIQLIIGIISFFIIALILSTFKGQIYIALWFLIGLFTLYFIRLTFPDVWNYVFWLLGIFILSFFAMLCMLQTRYTLGVHFYIAGFFIELGALAVVTKLILRIKEIRDDISGVTERPKGYELPREAAYVPLGLWALAVIVFWLISNISVYYWYNWSVLGWGPEAYLISNILLMFSTIYILWHPQMNFDWGVETVLLPSKDLKTGFGLLRKSQDIIPKVKKSVSISGSTRIRCPICGAKVISEYRSCRNCGRVRAFSWCKINEGYVVTCPHCKTQTSYGKDLCIKCRRPINRLVRCTCGAENLIKDWQLVQR